MENDKQNFLYVISARPDTGPCKIGVTLSPEKRVKQLQTGHAEKLQIIHTEPIGDSDRAKAFEKLVHRQIAHYRCQGEWFSITAEQAIREITFAVMTYDSVDNLVEKVRNRLV